MYTDIQSISRHVIFRYALFSSGCFYINIKKTSNRLKNMKVCRFTIPESIWEYSGKLACLNIICAYIGFLKRIISKIPSCNINLTICW